MTRMLEADRRFVDSCLLFVTIFCFFDSFTILRNTTYRYGVFSFGLIVFLEAGMIRSSRWTKNPQEGLLTCGLDVMGPP